MFRVPVRYPHHAVFVPTLLMPLPDALCVHNRRQVEASVCAVFHFGMIEPLPGIVAQGRDIARSKLSFQAHVRSWPLADMGSCTAHVRSAHMSASDPKRTSLARKNETGRRTVREQSTVGVRDAAFRRANTTATVEDFALSPDQAGI